jgi:anti-sigma B factor antagonist
VVLNFELRTEVSGATVLVELRGDLDVQVAARATDELIELEAAGHDSLVIDMRAVSFMDSSGMAVIAGAHARATAAGRRLTLVAPPAGVRHAFDVSGLAEVIPMVDDRGKVYPEREG